MRVVRLADTPFVPRRGASGGGGGRPRAPTMDVRRAAPARGGDRFRVGVAGVALAGACTAARGRLGRGGHDRPLAPCVPKGGDRHGIGMAGVCGANARLFARGGAGRFRCRLPRAPCVGVRRGAGRAAAAGGEGEGQQQ